MTHFDKITFALEENATRILTAVTAVMLAMFTSFLMVLAQASHAGAQTTGQDACGGTNLIEEYRANDPEKLATLEAEAEKEIFGNSIYWKIEKDGLPASYVLGTMHMADERIANLDGARLEGFSASQTVIVENIEALDPAQASAALLQHKDMTLYTDGTTLLERLDAETQAALKVAAEERGMPLGVVQIMRPWLVATSLALPACELAAKQSGKPVLDGLIVQKAREQGKQLVGLETIGEQFSAMANLPEDFHLEALRETLKMGDLAEDVIHTMKDLYLDGKIGMIMPLTKLVSPKTSGSGEYENFKDSLITRRNAVMVERSLPLLEKGAAFIAVGALHLPGESGLINSFEKAGYTVTPAG